MSKAKFHARLIHELEEMGQNPDLHPVHRGICQQAARVVKELADDLDANIRQGSDHA